MAVATITPTELHEHHVRWEHTAVTSELALAIGAVVVSIVGLAGILPMYLAAIVVIGLGAMVLFRAASIVSRSFELLTEAGGNRDAGCLGSQSRDLDGSFDRRGGRGAGHPGTGARCVH